MTKEELLKIKGGTSIVSSTLMNSLARVAGIIVEIGRMIGSSIRRVSEGSKCSI